VQVAALQVLEVVKARNYLRDYERLLRSPHWQVRVLAVDLLVMAEHQGIVKLVLPLLDDPERRVRVTAIQALSAAGGDAVVDPLIKALGRNEGRVLDDLADALARITGKDFGLNTVQWESWWSTNKGQVKIARIPAREYGKLKEAKEQAVTQVGSYFGLRVISKHVAFVFDCSESMLEAYVPPGLKPPEEPEEKAEPGKSKAAGPKKKRAAKAPRGDITTRIEVAKRELQQVLGKLPAGVMLNILRFNTFVESCKPALTELKDPARKEFTDFVRASNPEGLTNLYGALEEALKDDKVDTIYLLSDGAPTVGTFIETQAVLAEVARLNQLPKVKINTIGFHMKPEEAAFMQE
ncbi:MAG: HEAT repeat domain-containing protein, partial [Candidatus Methylomirabilales bacterium]